MGLCMVSFYVCVVVWGTYTCKIVKCGNKSFFFVCVVVEGMYTCKFCHFGNKPLFLCFFCIGRVHMED